MEDKDKVKFEEYEIEFSKEDFDGLSDKELKECKKLIEDIKKKIEE